MQGWAPEDLAVALVVLVAIVALIALTRGQSRKSDFKSHPQDFRPRVIEGTGFSPASPPQRPTAHEIPAPAAPVSSGESLPANDLRLVAEQMRAVTAGTFEKRRVLNRSEQRVFRIIEETVGHRDGYRVFAQPCLGEVLQSPDKAAFFAINAKRVDFLIVDGGALPVVAIEYQGEGHYQGVAAARDAIKKEALRKAGVRYFEVVPTDSDAQIVARVCEYLGWTPPAVAPPQRVAVSQSR